MRPKKYICEKKVQSIGYRLPLVEVYGRRRVLIENHDSIQGYGQQEITIKVSFGLIRIQGNKMKIRKLSKEKVIVSGEIDAVVFGGV